MNTEPSNFSESFPNEAFSWYRFVTIPSIKSDTNLWYMVTRSSQSCNRCISAELDTQFPYNFLPFCMIPKVLKNKLKEKVSRLILITSAWTTQVWYPKILYMSIKSPIFLPWIKDLLKNLKGQIHPLFQNRDLELVAWMVSGLDCRRREFQRQLLTLSRGQEDRILLQIMSWSGESGLVGILQ